MQLPRFKFTFEVTVVHKGKRKVLQETYHSTRLDTAANAVRKKLVTRGDTVLEIKYKEGVVTSGR